MDDCNCSRLSGRVRPARLFVLALSALLILGASTISLRADDGLGEAQCTPGGIDPCASDGNPCTEEFCNVETRVCESRPIVCQADDNLCTVEACNPSTGTCGSTPKVCDGEGGGDGVDGNPCTGSPVCNPSTGNCEPGEGTVCPPDDNLCTVESCNPEGGCVSTPVVCEADDNLCTVEACNPSTGTCGSTPKVCDGEGGGDGVDGNPCTGSPVCNPSTGNCEPGEGVVCPPDDNPCTVESCNPEGGCVSTPVVCDADDNLCTTEVCDPETGGCESGEPVACDQDKDECTTEVCDPETGECTSEPANPLPGECGASICRTPGFWGTHAGVEAVNKVKSVNITQAVINAAGGSLTVCGETITSTKVADDESALEAICVSPSGNIRLQLVRQLTAAALNCVMSGGDGDCTSTPLYSSIFAECNALCTQSGASTASITSCIGRIDCLNNGGKVLANGFCQTGTCRDGSPCGKEGCDDDSACTSDQSNCHAQLLVNEDLGLSFNPPGPAGSSKSCNNANKNTCTVVGSGQANCPN